MNFPDTLQRGQKTHFSKVKMRIILVEKWEHDTKRQQGAYSIRNSQCKTLHLKI